MALIPIAQHPAPWPLLDLDPAAMRVAGHKPTPFRQFILKVHSRCNLSCSYCYVYEMADQAWRGMPKRMSRVVAQKAVERIAEHAEAHTLESVDIIFHGGEPMLAGAQWLADLAEALFARVPAQVNLSLQTNGTLLDRSMLETLKRLHVQVGVSLDGDAEATDSTAATPTAATASMRSPMVWTFSGRRSSASVTAASCARSMLTTTPSPPMRRC